MAFVNRIGSLLKQNVRSTPFIYHAPPTKLFNRGILNPTTDTRDSFSNFGEVVDARMIVDRETDITAMNVMDQKVSSLVASPTCVSAMREFCSKLFGNGVIGFDMGTADSCVAAMKWKVEPGVPKYSGFEMNDKASDRTITLGREYSDGLGSEILSLMRPQKPSEVYHQGLGFLNSNMRKIPRVRFYSSGGRNTNFGPKRTKFAKQFKGRMKGKSSSGTHISFGKYGLQALEPAWVTARQIEAGRRAMSRHARSGGKIWVRVFPDKPITGKPAETRMGRGKGAVEYWTSVVKPGRILYEMDGVSEAVARSAIVLAAFKMPIKTRFIKL